LKFIIIIFMISDNWLSIFFVVMWFEVASLLMIVPSLYDCIDHERVCKKSMLLTYLLRFSYFYPFENFSKIMKNNKNLLILSIIT